MVRPCLRGSGRGAGDRKRRGKEEKERYIVWELGMGMWPGAGSLGLKPDYSLGDLTHLSLGLSFQNYKTGTGTLFSS